MLRILALSQLFLKYHIDVSLLTLVGLAALAEVWSCDNLVF
jgi:hypothetical protein